MSELLFAAAAGVPMAAGWSLHALRMRRRIEAARRDPLTGLFTRDAFAERAPKVLAGGRSAVYVIDLDRFKGINDTYGHAAGDAVIAATGGRLAEWADVNGGIVVRLGGDEFAAVARVFSLADLSWTLGELTRAIEQPVTVDGRSLTVGASVGAVAYDPRTDEVDLSTLLRLADEQMYAAKRSGADWLTALDLTPQSETANGRRAGRPGTHGGTEVTA
ncbi:GGDEF domain-containing protein [Streptomyces griseoaurantiacus]|uniref:Diguanylate cyclase (GGDEF) domain-containing protein n=1 Tax=Streptomyces griseoaurantiacus TaxID=68213 RepID=A0A1G7G6W1_9ACTN|nr:GGDEF domain-containing protein [Streptomyces jietaisiensis]SDE83868.1 diguanylate cyclase (GGDEF) domain-containing protein [Streptomyces jietaisiensis]